ncbi:acireductone synthase [Streptomyces sp. NPDC056883]|uniref:acireductone synthase n=1 Tax=Streptomyces sp. NPDC056883 TaxID=3345959 RepID=UPI0036ACDBB4
MILHDDVESVVLDIEGTTSATGFVLDVLYPYSRSAFGALLTQRATEPEVRRAVGRIRDLIGEPDADAARIEAVLGSWLDEDRKVTPLKSLQGIVWAEGFAAGELVSHFYDDVVPALRRWRAAGVRLHVYSSGSVAAQRAWFGHTPEGDLLSLIEGMFDTENPGPKQEADSYRAITRAVGTSAGRTLFLSDRTAELNAARSAGWLTTGLRREGEPYALEDDGGHPSVSTFTEITVVNPAGGSAA